MNEMLIPHIENALGIRLYDNQKDYLLANGLLGNERNTGKTTAYCIKLALSDGEPLNLKKPWEFSDELRLPEHKRYSRYFFRNEFMRIRAHLEAYGFPVRRVI
jgi:hypothetical protein